MKNRVINVINITSPEFRKRAFWKLLQFPWNSRFARFTCLNIPHEEFFNFPHARADKAGLQFLLATHFLPASGACDIIVGERIFNAAYRVSFKHSALDFIICYTLSSLCVANSVEMIVLHDPYFKKYHTLSCKYHTLSCILKCMHSIALMLVTL